MEPNALIRVEIGGIRSKYEICQRGFRNISFLAMFGHRDRKKIIEGTIWSQTHWSASKLVGSGRNAKFASNSTFPALPDDTCSYSASAQCLRSNFIFVKNFTWRWNFKIWRRSFKMWRQHFEIWVEIPRFGVEISSFGVGFLKCGVNNLRCGLKF